MCAAVLCAARRTQIKVQNLYTRTYSTKKYQGNIHSWNTLLWTAVHWQIWRWEWIKASGTKSEFQGYLTVISYSTVTFCNPRVEYQPACGPRALRCHVAARGVPWMATWEELTNWSKKFRATPEWKVSACNIQNVTPSYGRRRYNIPEGPINS